MKRIDAVIPMERLSSVNEALRLVDISGLTIFNTKGRGQNPIEQRTAGRGGVFTPEFNTNCTIMVVVRDADVDKVILSILEGASSGLAGEGKIFVSKIDEAVDIGSKQRGEQAL